MPDEHTPEELLALLDKTARKQFGLDPFGFLDAILRSPSARGYILGAVSEILLAEHLGSRGCEVKRIKEKWVGEKVHHGDLYVSADGEDWFVIESKGLKSNAERWRGIPQMPAGGESLERAMARRRRGDLGRWWRALPPERRERILASGAFDRGRVLDTHFVSGTAGRSGRRQATPLESEFDIVALDLFLRTGRHEFIFASSEALPASPKYPEHLQQNYLIDILVPGVDEGPTILPPWTWDFDEVFATLREPIDPYEMQVDSRKPGRREAEELEAEVEEIPPDEALAEAEPEPAAEPPI